MLENNGAVLKKLNVHGLIWLGIGVLWIPINDKYSCYWLGITKAMVIIQPY